MIIYPAPKWFRETVRAWFSETWTMRSMSDRAIDELFTKLVQKQPPQLHVVGDSREE